MCSTDPTLDLFFLPVTVSSLHSTYRTVKQRKGRCFYLTQPEIRQRATVVSWGLNCSPLEPSGTAVAQWLRCCATNRKVASSIPASINGFLT